MATRDVDTHTVARVYYAEPQRGQSERRWVRCGRQEASVPLEQCARCPHLVEITSDAHGRPVTVRCPDPLAQVAAEDVASGNIMLPRLPISELMTRNVLCVRPDLSLDALIELFVETGLKAVPVVDRDGALLGIVSEADALLEVHARPRVSDASAKEGTASGRARLGACERTPTAEGLMSALPITLPEHTPISQAAAVMVFEHASRVAVVSAKGEIVGMLSSTDILFWLARADGYLLGIGGRESP